MLITVEIDDKTQTGKSILHLLKDLSKTSKGINFIASVEDNELLEAMKRATKSGRSSKKELRKTIDAILSK
jgi:hypothetical protein